MRILHAINSLTSGGAERQLQLLCRSWDDPAFQHAIFCVRSAGNAIPRHKARIFESRSANPLSRAYLQSLGEAIDDFAPEVVHAWLPASMTIPAMLLAKFRGRRPVFSYRSRMQFHRPLSYPEFLTALLCAERIVSNNPIVDSHRAFRWLFARKHGVVIRNAVEIPALVRREGGQFPLDGRQWRLACVGRLTAAKNLFAVVEAVAALPDFPPWRLDLYGDGELRDEISRAIDAHGMRGRITLQGHQRDVYQHMARSDLLLMPSLWEGMPNVALESLALGLPAIVSNIGPHRELLPDRGTVLWVDPSRPSELTAAITACMAGRIDLPGMVTRGRDFASRFNPAQMVSEYREFYAGMMVSHTTGYDRQ